MLRILVWQKKSITLTEICLKINRKKEKIRAQRKKIFLDASDNYSVSYRITKWAFWESNCKTEYGISYECPVARGLQLDYFPFARNDMTLLHVSLAGFSVLRCNNSLRHLINWLIDVFLCPYTIKKKKKNKLKKKFYNCITWFVGFIGPCTTAVKHPCTKYF